MKAIHSKSNTPLVSIVMPTFNRVDYLPETIESILRQSYTNFELIVIDDGSSDNTESVVTSINDNRIIYVKNPANLGIQKTLNRGIFASKGKYIARIDDQDKWIDYKKLEQQVNFLENNSDHILVGTGVVFVDIDGRELYRYLHPTTDTEIRNKLLTKNMFTHSSVLFDKKAALRVGGYNESSELRHVEDYDLWLRLGSIGKLHNLEAYSVSYVVDSSGLTGKNRLTQIKKNLTLVRNYKNSYPHYVRALIRFYFRVIVYGYLRLDFFAYITAWSSRKNHKKTS